MTDRAALVEKVALIERLANDLAAQPGGRTARMCEIDRLISLIRAEVLEEAAKVCESELVGSFDQYSQGYNDGCEESAAAIRALNGYINER